jgi:hypothetical protein
LQALKENVVCWDAIHRKEYDRVITSFESNLELFYEGDKLIQVSTVDADRGCYLEEKKKKHIVGTRETITLDESRG